MVIPQEGQTTSIKHLGEKEGRVKKLPVEEATRPDRMWIVLSTEESMTNLEKDRGGGHS